MTGFLTRLRRDARGAAAALLAAMVIPLMLFVGSVVDVARIYTVKARLQQACDAGTLAGRRTMTDTSNLTPLDSNAVAQARAFFNNNFHQGWFQTNAVTFTPSKTSEAQVAGTATATVPMALMKMFGFPSKTLNVTCEARYDVADADIMFVLDQTGSMACLTSDDESTCDTYVGSNYVGNSDGSYSITEKSGSRISGLRSAVLSFFDTVTGQADASTNFRFGFVPYNATANVGKLLQPLGYVMTSANYQSREVDSTTPDVNNGNPTVTTLSKTQAQCTAVAGKTRTPATARTYDAGGTAHYVTISWTNNTCQQSDQIVVPNWKYKRELFDTSQFITGAAVDNPAMADSSTSTWSGCVEERLDLSSDNVTSFSMTSPPKDLDPDSAPANASDGWAPWWYDVEFARLADNELSADTARTVFGRPYKSGSNTIWYDGIARIYNEVACPLGAKRLTQTTLPGNSSASVKANVRTAIQTYLGAANGFRPYGTTYHDVGMTWGTRLLSPTGMFASDTAAWSGHNPPNRFIIFLTDGAMETDPAGEGGVYSEFGMERYDSRVANGATGTSLDNYHNARFLAACQLAKNRNIKIFVIAYAQAITPQLTGCASPGQAYYASDTAALNTAFSTIAKQVAMLRISK